MPREFKKLTLDEAFAGLDAMLKEAEKDASRPVTMGVSDECGTILCFYRMDGSGDFDREMVMKKCFAASWLGDSGSTMLQGLKARDYPFYEFNHPYGTVVPGGLPIVPTGTERKDMMDKGGDVGGDVRHMRGQIGACGVSGRGFDEDEAIANVGVKAIQEVFWGK